MTQSPRRESYSICHIGMAALALGLILAISAAPAQADSPYLYGIHWWGYTPGQPIDATPATLLDAPAYGGWDVETIITHTDSHWRASFFKPLYTDLYTNKNISLITRIDYKWGETVPAPTSPDYAGWPNHVVNNVVNVLAPACHIWQIGNEPNLTIEGNNWPDNKIQPADYAQIYRNVRNAIHNNADPSPAGQHIVLIAPPSPGGIITFPGGERWIHSNDWLGQVIDHIPHEEIDGFGIHAYGGSITDFRNSYASALNLIDSKGLQYRPVYMTEFAKDKNQTEASKAQFIRDAYADVNTWNQTPGNHNIVCLAYFVYDADQQASGAWNTTSIEYYRTNGLPLGDPNNMFTAYQETVALRYPAGEALMAPVANFSASPTDGRIPLTVGFTDESTGTYSNWSWSFGDGGTSPLADPSRTYSQPGLYTVSLTVSGNAGNSTKTRSDYIRVLPKIGDMDGDGDGDMDDYGLFQACYTGSGNPQTDPACAPALIDDDDDVDSADLQAFIDCMTGPNIPIGRGCSN